MTGQKEDSWSGFAPPRKIAFCVVTRLRRRVTTQKVILGPAAPRLPSLWDKLDGMGRALAAPEPTLELK
jgi:hypothetical protein